MTYELAFDRRALKEWQKLGHTIREQFKKKLAERLENPRVPAARLHGHADRYKIKLRASGGVVAQIRELSRSLVI